MHGEAREWVLKHLPDSVGRVIELGSRDVNGSLRDLFDDYTGVDLHDGPNVDVVADAATVELGLADLVVCCELLEHTSRPDLIVVNAYRLLRDGGRLILTCAGIGRTPHGQHGADRPADGEHYRNIRSELLDSWLKRAGFSEWLIKRGRNGGDVYAVADK